MWRSWALYRDRLIHEQSRLYQSDPYLGFKPIAGAVGSTKYWHFPDTQVRFDSDGFRIPMAADETQKPLVGLALGCSFTFGAHCAAEESYPYSIGQALGGRVRNAAVNSYGLAQMVLLAEKWVPRLRPPLVFVQYSPWLVTRAAGHFADISWGRVPTPYFAASAAGKVDIRYPVFCPICFDLEPRHSNWMRVGCPLFVHDDLCMLAYEARRAAGMVPRAAPLADIVREGYQAIADVCARQGSRMVIVVLGGDSSAVRIPQSFGPLPAVVVDAHAALLRRLPDQSMATYVANYCQVSGQYADQHPNARAHALIAQEVVKAIYGANLAWPEKSR